LIQIQKVTKKKQKALQVVQEALAKEQQQQQMHTKQISELTEALAKEKQLTKELKQALTNVELRSQEGVCALTKELEEMKISVARIL
jgi:HD-GYP domain-containing protein (c-di-GMP phosphodiesterase class II)